MISTIIGYLVSFVVSVIGATGYAGIFGLMLVESCGIPMPSEAIMPFSGFLVATGHLNFWLVALVGTLGNLAGSLLAYFIGYKGGRPLIEKYGKYFLISRHDLDKADHWFKNYGEATVLVGRLLPVIRTYISFPAGIAEMNLKKFVLFTFIGAFPWAVLFTWLGIKLQNNWTLIQEKLHNFDLLMLVIVIIFVALYIWRHLKHRSKSAHSAGSGDQLN
ncbi:MAG: DedA family protein [Patescibacteria group bacterium]